MTTRDPNHFLKFELAVEELEKKIAAYQEKLDAWSKKLASDPVYYLESSYELFETAARMRTLQEIVGAFVNRAAKGEIETTIAELRAFALRRAQGFRAVARSTSPTSNLMEQNKLQAWLDLAHDEGGWQHDWIRHAQWADPEVKAVYEREAKINAARNARKAARDELVRKAERWAKVALKKGNADGKCCDRLDTPAVFQIPVDAPVLGIEC
jgi:hypothetical protein